jgi:hypothetical protein
MSQTTIHRAANDPDLQARVQACVYDEAFNNVGVADSQYAQAVRTGFGNFTAMYWAVSNAVKVEYESGIVAGRGAPGHDQDVITDGAILSAVQAHWPPDVPLVEPPAPVAP